MGTFNRRRPRVVNTAAILAAAITLLTSSVKSQGLVTGIATSVTASTTCSNQFASIHASRWSWGDKLACGQQCLQLWRAEGNPEPKIMVQLVGVCQQCESNDLELSSESFDALPVDKNSSSLGIQWQIITCPESLRGNGVIASITNQTFSPKTSNPSSSPLTTSPSPSLSSSPRPASSSTSIPSSNQGTSSPSSVNDGNASHASNTSRTPSPSRRPTSNTSRLPPRDQGASNTSRTPSPATIPSPSRRPPSNTSRLPPRDQGASPRPSSLGNENNQSTAVQTPYPNTSPPSTNTLTSSPSTPSPNTPTSKPLTSSPLTPAPSKQTATRSPSKPFTPQPGPSPTSTPSSSPSNAKDNAQGSSPMPSISPAAPTDEDSHGGSSDHQNESPDADKRDTRRPHPKRSESTDGSLTSYSGSGSNVTDSSIGDVTSKPPPKQGDTSRKGSSGGDNGVQPTGSSGSSGAPGTSANDTNSKSKFFTGGFFTSPIFIGLFMGLIGFVGLVITYRAKKQRYSNPDHDQMIPNSQSPSVSAPLGDELGVATSRAMYTLTSPINIRSAISTFQ